jgi:hypothetical protein
MHMKELGIGTQEIILDNKVNMKQNFLVFNLFLAFITYPIASYCITVLPAPYSSSKPPIGNAIAKGLIGLGEIYNDSYQAKLAEQQKIIETRNKIYVYEMVRDYDPIRHDEFVSCIRASELPEDQKLIVICYFNDMFFKWKSTQ